MNALKTDLSRRNFLKGAGIVGAGSLAAGMLASCAPAENAPAAGNTEAPAADQAYAGPDFLRKPEPITEFASESTYDVVVVGAGNSGLSAALKANEDGAKVAVVQKEADASAYGFRASGIDLKNTSPAQKEAMVALMLKNAAFRADRKLLEAYADNSGEAIEWICKVLKEGAEINNDPDTHDSFDETYNGHTGHFISSVPETTWMGAAPALAAYAQSQGIDFFFETPAVQLVVEDGAVTGVVAGKEGDYMRVNATKGVILATGDYCGNPEMLDFFCPDINGFPPLTEGRTGDGHCMGVWAGGRIEPIGHSKMIHDFWMNSAPFLLVDPKGARMVDELIPWWELNTIMRPLMQANADTPDEARIWSIMDADWQAQAQEWNEIAPGTEIHSNPAPEEVTFTGNTIEELAEAIGADPATLRATVDRYNEMVTAGEDVDFGKDARFLKPVAKAPFQAIQRDFNWGLSAVLGGLVVDTENRVLGEGDEPIKGLFAVGNVSGPFFGSVDYHMQIGGLSVGRAITTGYIAGRAAATQ